MEERMAVEAALFRLKPGTDRAAFLRAAEAVTEDLRRMPGYVDRELSEGDDGRWLDLLHWASIEAAQTAAEAILRAPRSHPFMAMLDPASVTLIHLNPALVDRGVASPSTE